MVLQINDFEIDAVHSGDAWKICDFCVANADRLQSFFPKTLEQNLNPTLSEIFVAKKVKQFQEKTEFLFTLKHHETRKLAGLIYLKGINWTKQQGEFAYAVDYNFEGQGLISKSISELSNYAFENLELRTLQIIAHKSNIGSIKVAKNNGYKWIKTLYEAFTPVGKSALDMELYELYKLDK